MQTDRINHVPADPARRAASSVDTDNPATPIDTPGHEFPPSIYASIIGAFAWMLLVAWVAFNSSDGTDLDLGIVTVLGLVAFAIPFAMHHTSLRSTHDAPVSTRDFLRTSFDSYTGPMPARQAWMEAALIPIALAVAATLFGIVWLTS